MSILFFLVLSIIYNVSGHYFVDPTHKVAVCAPLRVGYSNMLKFWRSYEEEKNSGFITVSNEEPIPSWTQDPNSRGLQCPGFTQEGCMVCHFMHYQHCHKTTGRTPRSCCSYGSIKHDIYKRKVSGFYY